MNADREIGLQPIGEVFDELVAEIAPIPRSSFLKTMA
jgi:hypothetical protein